MRIYNIHFNMCISKCYVFFLLIALPLSASSTKRFDSALIGLTKNNLSMVDKAFLKVGLKSGNDQLLALYELGAFYHLCGNFKKSTNFLNMADAVTRAHEDKALVSIDGVRRYATAVLTNDSAIRYEGVNYDKVMSRTLNSVNYLFLGDIEGSLVELRKAEEYQRLSRECCKQTNSNKNDNKPMGAAARLYPILDDNNLANNELAVASVYGKMFDQVKDFSNSFDNAFTYFFASQVHFAQGSRGIDDAMVSIRRAYELMPHVSYIKSAYLDIARAHSRHAYDEAKTRLQVGNDHSVHNFMAIGSVVVCFEVGHAPEMELVKIPFNISNTLYTLTLPTYSNYKVIQRPLVIQTPVETVTTTTITDVGCLARKSLQERMPELIGRSLLSAITKAEIQRKVVKQSGPFAGFVAGVVGLCVSSADCRSWRSLPAELQIARFSLPAGSNRLTLLHGHDWIETVDLEVKTGSSTMILVRSLPGFRRIDVKVF